jgi:hypothetical protein
MIFPRSDDEPLIYKSGNASVALIGQRGLFLYF